MRGLVSGHTGDHPYPNANKGAFPPPLNRTRPFGPATDADPDQGADPRPHPVRRV